MTLVYLVALIYVLLYPFQFSPPDSHTPFLSFNILNTGRVPFLVENSDIIDVIENIILFIPFGVFLFAWFRGRFHSSELTIRFSVIAAGVVSMACEALQYFEPTRYSAIYDVGANVIGAAAGATGCWFGFLLAEKLRRKATLVG